MKEKISQLQLIGIWVSSTTILLHEALYKKQQYKNFIHLTCGNSISDAEWEEDQLPVSRGCSIFQFSKEEDRLVIR